MSRRTAGWASLARWAPPTMITAAVAFELLTPRAYSATPLMVAACVMGGAVLRPRGVWAVLAAAVLATVAVGALQRRLGQVSGVEQIVDVVVAAVVAVSVHRFVTRQESRLQVVRTVAEEVQRVLLPPLPPRIGDLEIGARYEAAQDETRVGGDLYAAQRGPDGVRLVLADVQGKGLGAVATVSLLLGAFREAASREADLIALAARMEAALEREAANADGPARTLFATALLVEFPDDRASVRVLNRGHPDPYLVRGGRVVPLSPGTPDLPLGLGSLSEVRSVPVSAPFEAGSVLVMVTDGLTEARNGAGEFYDPLPALAAAAPFATARQAADLLIVAVDRWAAGPATDDRAVLSVRRGRPGDRDGLTPAVD
ncbi:PP2C family protein-serine/threonine phosphatase [Kitasatospora sp. NBC_01539]|uniref:PP2C family protein-serine/threonine phosphatase n=1 Tax=Kitasatospora sp. NBC_01539 TaxID=2903577 RepID=UPI00386021BA